MEAPVSGTVEAAADVIMTLKAILDAGVLSN